MIGISPYIFAEFQFIFVRSTIAFIKSARGVARREDIRKWMAFP